MEAGAFEKELADISALNGTEGPPQNIFETKFQARTNAETLRDKLKGLYSGDKEGIACQLQLCRVLLFLANNQYETEEEADALKGVCRCYKVIEDAIAGRPYDFAAMPEESLDVILAAEEPLSAAGNDFVHLDVYLDVLNTTGLFLSNRDTKARTDDARKVLHLAERAFLAWYSKFRSTGGASAESLLASGAIGEKELTRQEGTYTTTLFLLAQVYLAKGSSQFGTKYCHLTMAHQLYCKKDFDTREWATNALHLSSYYASQQEFGCALHCLEAGKKMMPASPVDETTFGVVAWAFGKYYKTRLRFYATHREEQPSVQPMPDAMGKSEWWVDFPLPGVAPASTQPTLHTFEQAREEFRDGYGYMMAAMDYYVFEGCCTDYIAILQDVTDLYKSLMVFETSLERRIAMQMRRIALLEKLPDELSFQAYATLIRQLLFDLGDLEHDLLDLRAVQKKEGTGKPLSERLMTARAEAAKGYFVRFLDTFKDQKTGTMPKKFDEDLRVPMFRALMRVAQLESRVYHTTPQAEYDTIGRTIERYQAAIDYAGRNQMPPEIQQEVRLATEMAALLPGKQKEVWRAFNKSS